MSGNPNLSEEDRLSIAAFDRIEAMGVMRQHLEHAYARADDALAAIQCHLDSPDPAFLAIAVERLTMLLERIEKHEPHAARPVHLRNASR